MPLDAITPTLPVVNFMMMGVDAALGSHDRALLFLISHCGFFMFNFLNVGCLVLVQGFVLGRLRANKLSKLALAACFTQMTSCLCSIHRSNLNDEFGFFGHVSTGLGLMAYLPFNVATLHLLMNHKVDSHLDGFGFGLKMKYRHAGIFFFLAAGVGCFLIGYIDWEKSDFNYFRKFIAYSTVYQVLAMTIALYNFWKRKINLDESVISRGSMINVFVLCIALDILALGLARSGRPVLQYPATGLTFTVLCIITSFVGEMDFMKPSSATHCLPIAVAEDCRVAISESDDGCSIAVELTNAVHVREPHNNAIPVAHAHAVGVGFKPSIALEEQNPFPAVMTAYGSTDEINEEKTPILVHGIPSKDWLN